jgi:hypothetical protein
MGSVGAQEECLASVRGVPAHQRMAHGRILRALLLREEAGPDLVARPREVVDGHGVLDPPFEPIGQGGVRAACARELGGAAFRRDDARGEEGAEGGHGLEGAVAVPEHVGELIDHTTVLGRDEVASLDVEVRLAREGRARRGIHAAGDLEGTEALAEGDLLVVVQGLPAEEEDGMLVEGGADLRPGGIVHGPGDVGAVDARGEGWGEWCDLDGHYLVPPLAFAHLSSPRPLTPPHPALSPFGGEGDWRLGDGAEAF